MPATYEPIATTTLGSAASSITFSSIPNTYTDLRIIWFISSVSGTGTPGLRFNGATSPYSLTTLRGNGLDAASARYSDNYMYLSGTNSVPATGQPSLITVDVFSYASSTFKTCLSTGSFDRNGSGATVSTVGLWGNTSSINSITLMLNASNLNAGTTATIYGILKAQGI